MPTISERIDEAHARQLALDRVRASALGMTVEKYRHEQVDATLLHEIMEAAEVNDPMAVLPEIIVAIERAAKGAAIKTAVASARTEVQRLLRKAMVP
jgi:hypothetical protein